VKETFPDGFPEGMLLAGPAGWRLAGGRLRWPAPGGGAGATEWAKGGGGGKAGCGGGASVVGETWERGRFDRRKLVRPRILGWVVVSDSIVVLLLVLVVLVLVVPNERSSQQAAR
jgi:hypothetical protein